LLILSIFVAILLVVFTIPTMIEGGQAVASVPLVALAWTFGIFMLVFNTLGFAYCVISHIELLFGLFNSK
jgi:hypothetical protein